MDPCCRAGGLLDPAGSLSDRLSALTASLLVEAMPLIAAAGSGPEAERLQRLGVRPQGEEGLTYARLLTKDDLLLPWKDSALALHRRVMGLHPNAFSYWRGRRFKVRSSEPLVLRLRDQLSLEVAPLAERWGQQAGAPPLGLPGEVLACEPGLGLVVATGGCPLLIREGQLEGKAPAGGQALLQQLEPAPGEAFSDRPAP